MASFSPANAVWEQSLNTILCYSLWWINGLQLVFDKKEEPCTIYAVLHPCWTSRSWDCDYVTNEHPILYVRICKCVQCSDLGDGEFLNTKYWTPAFIILMRWNSHTELWNSLLFLSQIESSSTKKYCFLYVNKSYEVLGRSTSFHINHIDPRGDLDLIDLEDFAFVNSSPDQEQGEYRATKIY